MTKVAPGDSALVIFPTKEISVEIDKWRRVYDPNHKTIPPHMTIAFPPFISEKQWLLKRENFTTLFRTFGPFKITLQKLGYFKGDSFVLWLESKDGGNLLRIHTALQEQFPEYVPSSQVEYIPHMTIGFFESERALLQAKEVILAEWKTVQFIVYKLLYVALGDDGIWHIKDKLYLKNN